MYKRIPKPKLPGMMSRMIVAKWGKVLEPKKNVQKNS